jgi:hypothetical protein
MRRVAGAISFVSPNLSLQLSADFSPLILSRLGGRFGGVLESIVHNSPNNGTIEIIPSDKLIYYVLPIHVACSIIKIRPLVA